jgi:YjbE family integral membrane protein
LIIDLRLTSCYSNRQSSLHYLKGVFIMELFSAEWFAALLSIIMIDIVLAGDNAVVIGMAARNIPAHQQKKAIIYGTVGAVVIRVLATLVVVWLLNIPGLHLVGGLVLLWIAYKLLVEEKGHDINAANSLAGAIRTIIIADAAMGLDNVLAIGGAAAGHMSLVIIGLAISIPIVVWGSTLILKLMNRFPAIVYIGAGILAFTASKMITSEHFLLTLFASPVIKWGFVVLVTAAVLAGGKYKQQQREKARTPRAA